MEQNTRIGRIVALDEAHKVCNAEQFSFIAINNIQYMKHSIEARSFIDTLLSTIRLLAPS